MQQWLAYTRVSHVGDRAERLISPDQQAARIAAYADTRGLEIEALPPELDVSGGKVERPILSEAIERIERGEAAGIIVAQLDRLSRMDITDALRTIERIGDERVIAVAENFDARTPEGRLGRNVFLALGQMQLDRYKDQFMAAKRHAVEEGIWPTRTVPIGYRKNDDRTLAPDPQQARRVVKAFEARANGSSWREVGKILGYGHTGARNVISNRVYLGELRLKINGDEAINPSSHEPIISRDLFEAAQIAHPRPSRNGNPPALLAGILRCAHCRSLMTPAVDGGRRYYRCQAKQVGGCPSPAIVSARLIDPYVTEAALHVIEDIRFKASERIGEVESAEKVLSNVEAERDAFLAATSASGVDQRHFAAKLREHADAVESAERKLARARAANAVGPDLPAGSIRDLWQELSIEERRHLLRGALPVVFVRRGRGDVAARVRMLAEEPPDLPRTGWRNRPRGVVGIPWDEDLPGEIRAPATQDRQ